MSEIQVQDVVDAEGNLHVHNQQGAILNFGFEGIDVSARTYWFEMEQGIRIQLTNGAATDQKVLTISQGELSVGLDKISEYVIVDETDAVHELVLEGKIHVRGF